MATTPKATITRLNGEISVVVKSSILDPLLKELKDGTPVKTGRARSGWNKEQEYKHGQSGQTQTVIANRVPYIQPLDDGHSQQAPAGIVEPALARIQGRYK
jgi:hypothetical protein